MPALLANIAMGMLLAGQAYHNPVCSMRLPDPTVIRVDDAFWLYATEATRNVPILKSEDLVDWSLCGTVFTERTRPDFVDGGGIWSPDISRIGDRYVLYYSMSVWKGTGSCGIGVAVADSPEGPWQDHGKLFDSSTIGVRNSIDPFHVCDDGRHWLVWGVNYGIWCIELTEDGLAIKKGAQKRQLAGSSFGAASIIRHGGSYYLFMSAGVYGYGKRADSKIVVARADNLLGPYVDRRGRSALDGFAETLLGSNDEFIGVSHNSGIVTDVQGNDWILYHAWWSRHLDSGRMLMLDRILWKNGWPCVVGSSPSVVNPMPEFKR